MTACRSLLVLGMLCGLLPALRAEPLPNTKPLQAEGDLAAKMVAGIDKYLMRELAASVEQRKQYWKPDFSSPEAYAKSVRPNRERLKKILGVVDARIPFKELEYVSTTGTPALVAEGDGYKVYAVRWPVLEGVDAEGLLLEPKGKPKACVVALPDADWTPEMLVGLAPGVPKEGQFARRLVEDGCRVLVPTLIDRKDTWSGNPRIRMTNQPHREFVYRMAFEMGRHVIGYEIQKVLAAVDWFAREQGHAPVGVVGHGEGGLLALYSAAIDERLQGVIVSGYFAPREAQWKEPIYRNVWGLLREFGDAEIGALVEPRALLITPSADLDGNWFDVHPATASKPAPSLEHWPEVTGPPPEKPDRRGGAPGTLAKPAFADVKAEAQRLADLLKPSKSPRTISSHQSVLYKFLESLQGKAYRVELERRRLDVALVDLRKDFDPAPRQKRQFEQLVNFTQKLLRNSEVVRDKFFWSKLDLSSVEKFEKSTEPLRKYLAEEVIGQLPAPTQPLNPLTREAYDEPKWKGYEVTLDLYPDVFAYGVLLVPKDLKPGEKRPVVVCQHGLEGRPQDLVNPKMKTRFYNSYGAQLADLGYIVYAPQNPYIGKDDFRVLQRKANPLKLSLFSFIVRQHERTIDWLETLPFVDKSKIGLYGLSYGGKTAMRVPALEKRYCLSICSGDFNEWVEKMISVERRVSYMFTHEYEMYEFDLGSTFNYAEMSALIAPRPFMVERGHDDGVGIDEMVAYEFAKVRRLYTRLKLPERTELEFFDGGHVIHGQGTFAFLKKHLQWPK